MISMTWKQRLETYARLAENGSHASSLWEAYQGSLDVEFIDAHRAFLDDLRQALSHLSTLEAERAWRPIESAPRRQRLIFYWPATQDRAERQDIGTMYRSGPPLGATHWQSLPIPPKESAT